MPWNRVQEKSVLHSPLLRIGVAFGVALLIGAALLAPMARERYDRWSASGMAREAKDFYEKHEYHRAIGKAREALEKNASEPEAIRIIAKSMEALGDPLAIEWRRRLGAIKRGDVENTLAWADDAIKESDMPTAEYLLESLKPEDRTSAVYHDLAAWVALSKRDARAAEAHWEEAVRIEPGEDKYVQRLATLQLSSPVPEARSKALSVLDKLSEKPETRIATLRTILDDALKHRDFAKARALANTIGNAPDATFPDKLTQLGALRTMGEREADSLLAQLKERAASNAAELDSLLTWMNATEPAGAVLEWVGTLPEAVVSTPPACVPVADAYARDLRWNRLKEMLEAASWRDLEYLRRAHLARTLGRLDDAEGSEREWDNAMTLAGNSLGSLERLGRTVLGWGLLEKAEEVLWKAADREHCPRWVLNKLWSIASKRGDTSKLRRLSEVLVAADPSNIIHRNNLICLGLLLRDQESSTHDRMAEALYNEEPNNPIVASTYALSLYERGRLKEAVALMARLRPGDLRRPVVALYYGIFLNAAGYPGKAGEYLAIGAAGPLLPEERALLFESKAGLSDKSETYLRQLNEAAASDAGELARLITWMNGRELGPLVSKWSLNLPMKVASIPDVAAAVAESHVSAMDWKRLQKTVAASSWGELEYLRSGYRALILNRLDDLAGAAEAWKECVFGAEKSLESLERLAKAVQGWGWEQKSEEVLWKLIDEPRCPEWVIESLFGLAIRRADAVRLRKAAGLFVATQPDRVRVRNCAIARALLGKSNEVTVGEFAETLYREAPGDIPLASLHALALHQKGRPLEAMAIMTAFDAKDLEEPAAAFHYGIFLLAANRDALGRKYLDIAEKAKLLPEELALLSHIRASRSGEGAKSKPPEPVPGS